VGIVVLFPSDQGIGPLDIPVEFQHGADMEDDGPPPS